MTRSSVWGQGPASWFGGSEVRITQVGAELPSLGSTTAAARLALQTAVIQLINMMRVGGRIRGKGRMWWCHERVLVKHFLTTVSKSSYQVLYF